MEGEYQETLSRCLQEADSFSLVWRHEFKFSNKAAAIEDRLALHLIEEKVTSSWPGTELIGGKAVVRFYAVNSQSVAVLSEAKGIFSWLAPDRPEDLAFYKGGKVIFASIAHEHEAWFNEA